MIDDKPIIKSKTRVLRPWEWYSIRDHLKPSVQLYCDVAMCTGMRSTELAIFLKHPEWFNAARRVIELPQEAIKKKTTWTARTVLLSIGGVEAVKTLFSASSKARMGKDRSNLRKELMTATIEAGLDPRGITPKMFRKTLIAWLVAAIAEKDAYILMSLGHGSDVRQKHYLAAGFERRDVEDMRKYLVGWGE
jgi:integrase